MALHYLFLSLQFVLKTYKFCLFVFFLSWELARCMELSKDIFSYSVGIVSVKLLLLFSFILNILAFLRRVLLCSRRI